MAHSGVKDGWRGFWALLGPGILLLLTLPSLVRGESPDLDEVISNLQATYEGIQDLSAQFRQTSVQKSTGSKEESKGSLEIKKPGKMRWEYKEPEKRWIISDGRLLYIYSPSDRQAIIQDLSKGFTYSAVNLLTGMGNLREDFLIRWGKADGKGRGGELLLELKPVHSADQIDSILMEVHPKTFMVERIVLKDAFSNTTTITLRKVKTNTGLDDSLFTFVPPPGTEIIKGSPGRKGK